MKKMKNKILILSATFLFSIILCGTVSASLQYEVLDIPPDEPIQTTSDPSNIDESPNNTETSITESGIADNSFKNSSETQALTALNKKNTDKTTFTSNEQPLSKLIRLSATNAAAKANHDRRNDTPLILILLSILMLMAYYLNWKKTNPNPVMP